MDAIIRHCCLLFTIEKIIKPTTRWHLFLTPVNMEKKNILIGRIGAFLGFILTSVSTL